MVFQFISGESVRKDFVNFSTRQHEGNLHLIKLAILTYSVHLDSYRMGGLLSPCHFAPILFGLKQFPFTYTQYKNHPC